MATIITNYTTYSKPSAKAPVSDPGDEAPFLVWGRRGERTTHETA
jgi:hypothetical protein